MSYVLKKKKPLKREQRKNGKRERSGKLLSPPYGTTAESDNQECSTISFVCCSCCSANLLEDFADIGVEAHLAFGNPHNLHVKMPLEKTRDFLTEIGYKPYSKHVKDKRATYKIYNGAR